MVEMGNVFYNLFSLVGHYYETALPPSPPCVLPSQPTVLPDKKQCNHQVTTTRQHHHTTAAGGVRGTITW